MSGPGLQVLFVDDEGRVLDAMRRALYRHRHRWTMAFVDSGAAALRALTAVAYDVIITDMRMPAMNGALLLAEVARLSPSTARIVLSGQTDGQSARRAAHVAHQFLAKPIDTAGVVALLERLERMRGSLSDPAIVRRIGSANPIVAARDPEMAAICADPSITRTVAAQRIRRSPLLLAKTLQLAGSAFFARPYHGTSIETIVDHVGLKSLVSVVCDDVPCCSAAHDTDAGAAWRARMYATATLAVDLAAGRVAADDAFAATLLHDVGRVLMPGDSGERCSPTASAYLLDLWGLPDAIVTAVRWQDNPAAAREHAVLAGVVRMARHHASIQPLLMELAS